MTFLDEPYTPQTYSPKQLAQIHSDNREELAEAYRILEEQDYDQRPLCTDRLMQQKTHNDVSQHTPKNHRYTVKFQVIKLYSVDVIATNSGDADDKAMQIFKQCPQSLIALNTCIGHTTIEQLQGGA